MDAAFFVGDEGAFGVDAERPSFAGGGVLFDGGGEFFQGCKGSVDARGDCCGEPGSYAARGEEFADGGDDGRGPFHYVVTNAAVDVDVDEGGEKSCAGIVD